MAQPHGAARHHHIYPPQRLSSHRADITPVGIIRYGLQWKDAPSGYGPHKTLYNRFIRYSRLGVFDRIFGALAGEGPKAERID